MTGNRCNAGFTLTELMITVVLIGILAAIAIPNFLAYQAKSRRAEAYANVVAIATSELSYQAESDLYVDTGAFPDFTPYGGLGTHKMTWDAASVAEYSLLGWSPEGEVAYSYEVNAGLGAPCSCSLCFTATAHGDVDGDGTRGAVMYVYPEETGGVITECPSGMFGYGTPLRKGSLTDKVYKEAAINYSTGDEF
jgi:type IV pilus assembly protein PilA